HILPVYPLMAIVGAYGATRMWTWSYGRKLVRVAVIGLLAWQTLSVVRAYPDYVPYLNEFAHATREPPLLWGCDFDCGQDVLRLADKLQKVGAKHAWLALWTSADLARLGFPAYDELEGNQRATGWVAISDLVQ